MNAPHPESFEIILDKRDELIVLDPDQQRLTEEIIATCDTVRELNEAFPAPEQFTSFTYTRG
jgi:siroheme synthase (precorrin-2 oxidase/ferrochelatase)